MSYSSIKRVLGETNLERKCRFLFGTCLLILMAGSFYSVWGRTKELIYDADRDDARMFVDSLLMKRHFEILYIDESSDDSLDADAEMTNDERAQAEGLAEAMQDMSNSLFDRALEWSILVFPDERDLEMIQRTDPQTKLMYPDDKVGQDFLDELLQEQERQIEEAEEASRNTDQDDLPLDALPTGTESADDLLDELSKTPANRDYRVSEPSGTPGEYHYYQAVYWKKNCLSYCHSSYTNQSQIGAVPDADAGLNDVDPPFRVVKVVLPSETTESALRWNLAFLITSAIITVFVSMIALYVIVRYVIVKPLKHLRDVSDEVSRGNTALRADIQTGDEFEELATSFNRMLRHLVDAHYELREVNTDLDAKVDELAQANMHLFEMNRVKGDFLANMSHELRTPLNSIIGFADVLQNHKGLDEKQRRYATNIRSSGRALLDMINDILDLAKMESGKIELRLTEFDIKMLIGSQCELVRSLAEEKNIDLVVDIEAELPPLYQDQGKVQQILTNLLSNSIKFTPEGGRITVSAERLSRGDLELAVADTGVGIAEEDFEAIFEKFRQGTSSPGGDNLTREYSGTGLGLSIVKELCILLGGEVDFESELGKGSRFAARLPWKRADRPHRNADLAARLDELTRPTS